MKRAFLISALTVVAATGWADAPSAPDAKTEAAADSTAAPAEQAATASETKTAPVATEADKKLAFKPPAGYKPQRVNGEQVWCAKQVILGSRFPQQVCHNEAELREMIRDRNSMQNDMDRRRPVIP